MGESTESQSRARSNPDYLTTLFETGTASGLTDGELLDRFVGRRGESAEAAFAALLQRHGGMVRRVCREILENAHDADDAFQAVFLILARSAGTIRHRGSVGPWLYGTALRVSRCARSSRARRRRHERRRGSMDEAANGASNAESFDPAVGRAIHEEIGRLAEKHRSPVVLCYLEGLTHEMAAHQLGWPVGTVRSRLAWARDKLKSRLERRGIAPSLIPAGLARVGELAVTSTPKIPISSALTESTLRAAMEMASADPALAGTVSASVAALIEEGLKSMFWAKFKLLAATTLAAGAITAGAGIGAYSYSDSLRSADGGDQEQQPAAPAVSKKPEEKAKKAELPRVSPPGGTAIVLNPGDRLHAMALGQVRDLIKEYDTRYAETSKRFNLARGTAPEFQQEILVKGPNVAMYAGGLLGIAEQFRGTSAAEEALAWIVKHLLFGSISERGKEILARDHASSTGLANFFDQNISLLPGNSWGSPGAEKLLRNVASKNPSRKIQGLATYQLAKFLIQQADYLLGQGRFSFDGFNRQSHRLPAAGWGDDYFDRLAKKDPDRLIREAEQLFERVIAEPDFAGIEVRDVYDLRLPDHPATLAAAAKIRLDEIRRLGVGKPVPEIAGIDFDGKPFKLSDQRGKVALIYFCELVRSDPGIPLGFSPKALRIRDALNQHPAGSAVALGVPVADVIEIQTPTSVMYLTGPRPAIVGLDLPKGEQVKLPTRDQVKSAVQAANSPIRFLPDFGPDGQPGPIRTAWHAQGGDIILVDHRGVIRFKQSSAGGAFEEMLKKLVDEGAKNLAAEKKAAP